MVQGGASGDFAKVEISKVFPAVHCGGVNCHTLAPFVLTLSGPLVWLQHQVLLGLLQLLLQTLVLGSDFTDPLLTVLQQPELGADIHHLLTHTQERQTGMVHI